MKPFYFQKHKGENRKEGIEIKCFWVLQHPIFRVYAMVLNNSKKECFLRSSLPLLPTNRKSPAGSCSCRGFEPRWKNWESRQRGYWGGTKERCRERGKLRSKRYRNQTGLQNWKVKIKEKRKAQKEDTCIRQDLSVSTSPFTFFSALSLPLFISYFSCSAPPFLSPRFSPTSKKYTSLNLILLWNNSFFTHRHMHTQKYIERSSCNP